MRTTIDLDEAAIAAIERLRRAEGLGVSEAVNRLILRGLLVRQEAPPFRQETRRLGIRIDVANIAEAIDLLEGPDAR